MKNLNENDKMNNNKIIIPSEKVKNELNKENISKLNYKETENTIKHNNNKSYIDKIQTDLNNSQNNDKKNEIMAPKEIYFKNKNFKNPNYIMEKIYSLSYFNQDKEKLNNNNVKDNKTILEDFLYKNKDNNSQNLEENKKFEEYEKIINYTSAWSSIENDKNSNKNNSNKFKKIMKNEYNSFDKENIELNMINNVNEEKTTNNIFSPILSDIKNNEELEKEKLAICDVNSIKISKAPNLDQILYFNKIENNVFNKNNKRDTKSQILKNFEKINKTNNDKSVKNKLYHYLKKMDLNNTNNNNNSNLRLKILNQKIYNKKYLDFNKNKENTKELTYTGLKRYLNYSTPTIKKIEIAANYILSNKGRHNKLNRIKNELNKLCNFNYLTYNNNNKKVEINNNKIDNIYKSIIQPKINNNNENRLNNILNELNKTMRKFPKNEKNNNSNINMNKTLRTFPINVFDMNEISKTNKNNNAKNIYFDFKKPEIKNKFNQFNEKNEKLIFESKVNNMNSTITKLLLKNSESYNYKNIHPSNVLKKTRSISIITNIRKQSFFKK